MRTLLDAAADGGYAMGAFGISNLEHTHAIMRAAAETQSPVVMMISNRNINYAGAPFLYALARTAVEQYPDIPMAIHLDHGLSPKSCIEMIDLGFSSVMIDGSLHEDGSTPADYEYNLRVTKEVVAYARPRGVTVEGEIGTLARIDGGESDRLTDPDQAVDFVKQTGVDALAVAIGTSHGAYKFSKRPDDDMLAMSLLEEIHERLPDTHLVLHGASSVPEHLVEEINRYGGAMKPAYGVPTEELVRAIGLGVRKINVDTDSRLAMTAAIRKVFAEHPETYDPRDYLKPATTAMAELVAARMRSFGQAGQAASV
jgi:fructose-bisphosphate aldolase class II